MLSKVNFLSRTGYLFEPELCDALLNKRLPNESIPGPYLIFIKSLNKDKKQLVYNYIRYNDLFTPALLNYLVNRWRYNSLLFSQWGKYLVIMAVEDPNKKESYLANKNENFKEILDIYLRYRNNQDPIGFINGLTHVTKHDHMSLLIDLAFKKSYSEYLKEILTDTTLYNTYVKSFYADFKVININLLEHSLYFVTKLKPFLSSVEKRGYEINQGPQKWRGQLNGLRNKLFCLDIDFRKSLYNHSQYHFKLCDQPNISRDKFSFDNIHMNLGDIEW